MFTNYYEDTVPKDPLLTFYVNGTTKDFTKQPSMTMPLEQIKRISFNHLYMLLSQNFQFPMKKECSLRLFDDQGVEIYQDDLKYIKKDTVLYASNGEEFDPASCFAEYNLLGKLGEGGFGSVLLGQHKRTKVKVAIKIVNTTIMGNAQDIDMVFREAEMLKSLRHKNIVNIYKCYTLSNMQVVFIMEYLEGGELLSYLEEKGKLTEDEARVMIKQIAEAVSYCHQQKLIHRDLKLENIMLAQKGSQLVKIVDFGIAGLVNNLSMDKIDIGSLRYMAPETLSGKTTKIGPPIDIWALGCILFGLVTGSLPFNGKTTIEIRNSILNLNYKLPQDMDFSLDFKDLISRILILDPNKRIKITDILAHPWMFNEEQNTLDKPVTDRPKVSIARETTVKFLSTEEPPKPQRKPNPKPPIQKQKDLWIPNQAIEELLEKDLKRKGSGKPTVLTPIVKSQNSNVRKFNYHIDNGLPKVSLRPFSHRSSREIGVESQQSLKGVKKFSQVSEASVRTDHEDAQSNTSLKKGINSENKNVGIPSFIQQSSQRVISIAERKSSLKVPRISSVRPIVNR